MVETRTALTWTQAVVRAEGIEQCLINSPGGHVDGPLSVDWQVHEVPGGLHVALLLYPHRPVTLKSAEVHAHMQMSAAAQVLCNGVQSWTTTRARRSDECVHPMIPGVRWLLGPFGDALLTSTDGRPGCFHGFGYAELHDQNYLGDDAVLWGQTTEMGGYTVVRFDMRNHRVTLHADVEGLVIDRPIALINMLVTRGPQRDVYQRWQQARGLQAVNHKRMSGWTSWYRHFTAVTERDVLDAANAFTRLGAPVDVIQIDDGWQQGVGDWDEVRRDKFPSGIGGLAQRLKAQGFVPGLWFAPFVVAKRSNAFLTHPTWLARDAKGRPQRAGYNPWWGGDFYALDLDIPEVRHAIAHSLKRSVAEGMALLKLDFLYAAHYRHQRNQPRGARMREALQWLRDELPDVTLLGCGVPLVPAMGLVDYCRIGTDTTPQFEDTKLRLVGYRERPSTQSALQSMIGRAPLHRLGFVNDTDVFILRTHDNRLNAHERELLFVLSVALGSFVLTSDDVLRYAPDERQRFLGLFPLLEPRIEHTAHDHPRVQIRLTVAGHRYFLFANLSNQRMMFTLESGVYSDHEGRLYRDAVELGCRSAILLHHVAPGGVAVASTPQFFPGSDVVLTHDPDEKSYRLTRDPRARTTGMVTLLIEDASDEVCVNGQHHPVTSAGLCRVVRLPLEHLPPTEM